MARTCRCGDGGGCVCVCVWRWVCVCVCVCVYVFGPLSCRRSHAVTRRRSTSWAAAAFRTGPTWPCHLTAWKSCRRPSAGASPRWKTSPKMSSPLSRSPVWSPSACRYAPARAQAARVVTGRGLTVDDAPAAPLPACAIQLVGLVFAVLAFASAPTKSDQERLLEEEAERLNRTWTIPSKTPVVSSLDRGNTAIAT